jgi:hypothetical protein
MCHVLFLRYIYVWNVNVIYKSFSETSQTIFNFRDIWSNHPPSCFIITFNLMKGNGNIFFIFLFEKTFKTIYNIPLLFFHILLTSTNILIERNEMSAIFNFCRYACHVTTGVTQYFYLDNHESFCTQNYTLSALRNIKITQNL